MHIICGKCNVYADWTTCGCTFSFPIYVCQRNDDWDSHDVLAVFTNASDAISYISLYGYAVYVFDVNSEINNDE